MILLKKLSLFVAINTLDCYAWFMGRPIFVKLNKLLLLASLRALGILNYRNFCISGEAGFARKILFKPKKSRYSTQVFNTGIIVFDVGANIGSYTQMLLALRLNQDLTIYCFEPSAKTFINLKDNLAFEKSCHLFNIALSNESGEFELFDYEESAGSSHASLQKDVIEKCHLSRSSSSLVQVRTGDNVCLENNVHNIDLLKIDAEGHELSVLRGFSCMISERSIKAIQFEFSEIMIPSRTFLGDFIEILPNYDFYRLLPNGHLLPLRHNELPVYLYQNIVCLLR